MDAACGGRPFTGRYASFFPAKAVSVAANNLLPTGLLEAIAYFNYPGVRPITMFTSRPPGGQMRKTVSIAAGIAAAATIAFVAASCGSDSTAPTGKQYVANMIAANEQANPPITTTGTGVFTFVDLGTEIDWTLTLTNMTAVIASHIHLGDVNAVNATAGPVIINLFLPNGPTGTLNGLVTHGIITNANNANVSLDSLRVLFNNGHAYANVHTTANPGGEIRDQIHPM
jgi:hypothetical protein